MKLKFNQTCKDKNTSQTYVSNETYEFEEERAKEILATGYAELVEEKEEPKEPKQPETPVNPDEAIEQGEMVNLHDLSRKKLVEIAKEVGVTTSGTKDELIERILETQEHE